MNTIRHYDAYFTFDPIASTTQAAIREIMHQQGLGIDVYDNALEFRFDGTDFGDDIVKEFVEIAAILKDAAGEMRCEIWDEEQDPIFRFYTISQSRLWEQPARLIRSHEKYPAGETCREGVSPVQAFSSPAIAPNSETEARVRRGRPPRGTQEQPPESV